MRVNGLFLAASFAVAANSISTDQEKNNYLRSNLSSKGDFLLFKLAERNFERFFEDQIKNSGRSLQQNYRRLDKPSRRLGNDVHTCGQNEVYNGHFVLGYHHNWSPMNSVLSMVSDDEGGHAVKAASRVGWFSGISTNLRPSTCLEVGDSINIHVRLKVPAEAGYCVPITEQKEHCPLVVLGSEFANGTHYQERLYDPSMTWDHEEWNYYNKEHTLDENNAGPDVINKYIVIVGGIGDLIVSDVTVSGIEADDTEQLCIDKCKHGSWLHADTTCQEAVDKYGRDYDECMAELNIFSHMDNLEEFCRDICVDHVLPHATEQ